MFKRLCFLTVLMAMVAVTANVAQAGSVRESFGTQGTIDMHYADNETTLLQEDSGLTWGGYNTYTGTRITNALVLVKPAGLQFDKWVMDEGTGSYAYTSWDGVLPSLDMSNGAEIELTARESTGVAVEFSILLRAGGTWYVSETNVTIQDTIVIGEPQLHTFDPAATTWEELDPNTNSMLNAQADGDERPIVGTGTTGITLTTELADVTGGGLLVPSSQERNPVQFDFIKFSQDPTLNDEPVVTINNSERWAHLIDSYNPGTDTAPGTNWVYLEDGKGWQAINNAEAFDDDDSPSPLTYTWEAISYVGTETDEATAKAAVEFNRSGGDDGAGANALDPNIVYNYRGTYTVTLTAFDGADYSTPATLTTHVVDNIAPTVTDIAGNLERTRYVGDILKLNPAISDDNYPVDFAKTEQHIRYLSGPVGSMTFRYGSGASYRTSVDSFVGIGKGHPMVDSRSPEDPNITFPVGVLGVYKFDVHAYDGDMYSWESDSDPNQTWTINVIDNRAMTGVDAGGNQIGIKDRNVNLIGTINDPDYDEHPENQTVIEWSVEEGPGGAGYTIGDAGSLVTTFNADTPGEYTLQLHVREESLSTGIIDANDTTVITIFGASYKTMTIKPSDDTSVRGGNLGIGQNYGGEVLLRTRDGDAGDYRKAYVKFDLNQIPGVITTANATFSIMSAESMNDFDTEIHNTSYGEGGEWFEGDGRQETDTGLYPDTTGVGLTYDSDTLPVTRGRVARRAAADWGSDQRKTFDVSGMRIEDDNKVTFRISTLQDDGNEDFYSKEASDLEAEQSPLLTIAYDPNQPHMPSPPDGMSQVDPMLAQLGWRLFGADKGTQECEVFFGTDSSPSVSIGTVSKLDAPNHMTDPNMVFDLASHVTLPLTPNLTYYWYVKPTYGSASQIFSFSTTDPPINTTPADGSTPNPGLTFRWVNPADSFDIHISQVEEDVNSLNGNALVKTGVVGNEWFPEHEMIDFILSGDVDYGGEEEVYFWRVVAKSAVGPDAPSEMTSFTTGNYELIDNFGSDTNSDHLYRRAVGDEFVAGNGKATWTASGSAKIFMVDNSISEPNKVGPADNNGTSLRIDYKDSAGIATATCVFANTRDWSSAVNRASMRFQLLGLAGNSEQIKVTVTDTSDTSDFVTFLADDDQTEEAMTAGSWNNFTAIDLSIADMTAIDQSSIKSFSISVGNGVGSDEGAVWIDNIQIHRVRCLGKMIPYYFSAGDCAADVNELEVIASKWLRDVSATTVTAAVSPPSPSPVLHHDFETFTLGTTFTGIYGNELARWIKSPEPAGGNQSSDVYDSGYLSGNNNSMRVNSTTRMETSSFTNLPTGNWTLSIWVKPDQVTDHLNPDGTIVQQRPWRLRGGPDNQQTYMRLNIFDSDGDTSAAGAGLGSNLSEDVDVIAIEGTWTHVAYVHDYDNLSSALYVNGLKINENTDDEDLLPFPSQVGNMRMPHNNADNGYNGLTDEVRLYDYALSHEDILYLADVGSVSQPVLGVSMAGDLNGDETWNIIDLAELSASYHKDDVWWP